MKDNKVINNIRNHKEAERFYNARYAQHYMENWPLEKCDRIAEVIKTISLPKKGVALDFGCGTGVFTNIIKKYLKEWDVYGTDISNTALDVAKLKNNECKFLPLEECYKLLNGKCDFLFSHHVLEHVQDINSTAEVIKTLLSSNGTMLHILPCANEGSFEHRICMLRKDGIVGNTETRFFYDEEGHLRRLTSHKLAQLWPELRICKSYFSNQFYGGIRFATTDLNFLVYFSNPLNGINIFSKLKLCFIMIPLLMLWFILKPLKIIENKLVFGFHNPKDYLIFGISISMFPFSKIFNYTLNTLTKREWINKRHNPGGSEMYICLTKQNDCYKLG